ncbi:MAG: metallophosphoesterase, partial [Actinomycetota bacterium]|nr:metallophosphoesterase [Actinomycetota bacterium]
VHGPPLPWRDLRDGMTARGWLDLTNAAGELVVDGRRIVFAGVDDSHLKRDRYDLVSGPADRSAEVRIGLAHSPEPRVLDRFAADGYDLLLCGHTHGGQLRVPFYGALVTNCGINRARARWLHRWADPTPDSPAGTWLHVSAGLGTSPYAPVRFACPPEATLLTLTARPA